MWRSGTLARTCHSDATPGPLDLGIYSSSWEQAYAASYCVHRLTDVSDLVNTVPRALT